MNTEELQAFIIKTLEDYKAVDITTLDVRSMTDIADAMIICSGTSKRHLQTLAEQLVVGAKEHGLTPNGVEGEKEGEWVLVDLTDVIVHIMMPATRNFYSLEKLWTTTEKLRGADDR